MDTNKKQIKKQTLVAIGFFILTVFSLMSAGSVKAASSSPAATFVGSDTVSQGNWQSKYGADGYSIANSSQTLPKYGSFAPQNQANYTWIANTGDVRALQTATGRIASTWYAGSAFSMDVNLTDGNTHQVAIYALDWDSENRSETIQIVNATSGRVLDTRSISSFITGTYLVWNIRGHVTVKVQLTGGINPVVSGIFFGGPAAAGSTAAFVATDTSSQGNWQGRYGIDGYSIANSSQVLPSYASFTAQNQANYTWIGNTTDVRALQIASGRIASTWYAGSAFSMDVNLTDGNTHQVAIYALDWDSENRSETIQIVNTGSGAVLDTRTISSFVTGTYLVWNVRGHVTVNVQLAGGLNPVVSGIFFGGTTSNVIAPVITTQPVSQTVTSGQSATFSVADTGTAPLIYQWKKNGTVISGAVSSSYTTPATVTSDNGSQFVVAVSNSAGTATSNNGVLTVNAPTLILNSSATSLSFGSVNVSASAAQTVTLTNAGAGSVTISTVSVSGPGFNASGVPSGTILAPGQSTALIVTFAPASSGNAVGSVSVASNATGGAKVVALSGTGTASSVHSVLLSWTPSTSSVVGYNVYASTVSGSGYANLTPGTVATLSYTDGGLQTAGTRYYVVTSVDSTNTESAFSNEVSAIIP